MTNENTMTEEQYKDYRKRLFEETVLDMVEHICEELIDDPKGVTVNYTVDAKNANLTVVVSKEKIHDLLGKRSETLVALKKLAFKVANKHEFYLVLRIEEE
jgi:predicted RNA-binding protein YlqC (UPF0109 family)